VVRECLCHVCLLLPFFFCTITVRVRVRVRIVRVRVRVRVRIVFSLVVCAGCV
jgi:hypothetical protein